MENKPAISSKINLTQIMSLICMLLAMFGLDVDADMQAKILATLVAVTNCVTVVFRVWFSGKKISGFIKS